MRQTAFLLLLLVLAAAALISYQSLGDSRRQVAALQKRLSTAESEIERLRADATVQAERTRQAARMAAASSVLPTALPVAPPASAGMQQPQYVEDQEEPDHGSNDWRAFQVARKTAETLGLDQLQRDRLQQEVSRKLRAGERFTDVELVTDALGKDLGDRLADEQARAMEREEADALEARTLLLSRRLSLSQGQEVQLRTALRGISKSLLPLRQQISQEMEQAIRNHDGGGKSRDELRASYETLRALNQQMQEQRRAKLVDEMRSVLSPEQLVALEAEDDRALP